MSEPSAVEPDKPSPRWKVHGRVQDWVALNHARYWENCKLRQWCCRYGNGKYEGSFDRRRAMEFETSSLLY